MEVTNVDRHEHKEEVYKNNELKDDRGRFFKHSEFYEISCDVSLKPIMHINERRSCAPF